MEKQKSRILAIASAALILASQTSLAADYSVIHAFSGTDGNDPSVGVLLDGNDDLYSTTAAGGNYHSKACDGGCGTVFKLEPDGFETILHTFTYKKTAMPRPAWSPIKQEIFTAPLLSIRIRKRAALI